MSTAPITSRAYVWLLVVPAAVFAAGVVSWLIDWRLGVDSAVYRSAAVTLLHGEPLYDSMALPAEPWWARLPFTYPPSAALLFAPLAAVPTQVAWGLLGAASVLGTAMVIRTCIKVLPRRPAWLAPRWTTLVLCVLVLGIEPVWHTLLFGQVNLILMAVIVLDVLIIGAAGGRLRQFGGVLIGVAAAIKVTPLIFVLHLLLTGRRADAMRATGTFLALQGLMILVSSHDVVRFWGHAVTDPERTGPVFWAGNQSLYGLVLRISHGATWSLAVAIGLGALLAIPAALLVRRLHQRGAVLPALLVTAFFGLVVSPVSWSHHWVWAVPLIVYLLSRLPDRMPRPLWGRLAALAGLVAVFASCVVLILDRDRHQLPDWGLVEFLLGSAYLLVPAVAAAFVLVRLRRLR